MLEFIGLSSLDELFTAVPEALRLAAGGGGAGEGHHLALPDGLV